MRVGLISHEGGGIASVTLGLARSLARKRVPTTIFIGTTARSQQTEKLNEYSQVVRFRIVDLPPRSVWFQIMNLNKLLDELRKCNVVHGVSPDASFFFTYYKRKLKKPFVATIHGSARSFQREFVHSPLSCWTLGDVANHIFKFPVNDLATRRCLVNSDHAVICSHTALNELRVYKNMKLEKVTVIYNGIDLNEINGVKQTSNVSTDFSIIYAGRLVWTKGITFLLKSFRILRQNMKNVNLRIFGSGPLTKEVERLIVQSELSDCVRLQSHIDHKDLIKEIKKSTLAVLPSLYEGQPMFALEAMACKKPLLVFDVPYARELVIDMETGLLCKAYDCIDLAEKISLLLSDENLRGKLGQNAYDYVSENHDWDVQADKYMDVYEETLEKTSRIG